MHQQGVIIGVTEDGVSLLNFWSGRCCRDNDVKWVWKSELEQREGEGKPANAFFQNYSSHAPPSSSSRTIPSWSSLHIRRWNILKLLSNVSADDTFQWICTIHVTNRGRKRTSFPILGAVSWANWHSMIRSPPPCHGLCSILRQEQIMIGIDSWQPGSNWIFSLCLKLPWSMPIYIGLARTSGGGGAGRLQLQLQLRPNTVSPVTSMTSSIITYTRACTPCTCTNPNYH